MGQLHASEQKATERAQDVANKTEAKAQELYEQGQIEAESLAQHLSQNAADMYDKSKKKVNQLEKQLTGYSQDVTKLVKKEPLGALVIAGGIGFLLSRLLSK